MFVTSELKYTDGCDPYELPKREHQDDLEQWPAVTYIIVRLHLKLLQLSAVTFFRRICKSRMFRFLLLIT